MGYLEVGIDQTAGAGEITGSGTANTIAMFTASTVIGNSVITQGLNGVAVDISPTVATSGNVTAFNITQAANTGQTATTEINGTKFLGASRQWATGAITTQREHYWSTTTYTAVGASVITNAYGAYFEAPTASTNITITNNYSAGFSGAVKVIAANTTNTISSLRVFESTDTTQMFGIYNDGHMALGATNPIATTFRISANHTGGGTGTGIFLQGAIQSDVSTTFRGLFIQPSYAGSGAMGNYLGVSSSTPSLGSATLTNVTYYDTGTDLAAASGNQYGYFSRLVAGTTRWNFYATGSAPNYFAGFVGINQTTATGSLEVVQQSSSSGTARIFLLTGGSRTAQTASTEINQILWTSGSRQWAAGAITTQREFYITSPSYSFNGASTITNAYTAYFEAPTASTNATITYSYSAGFSGGNGVQIQTGSIGNQGLVLRDYIGDSTQAAIYGGVTPAAGNVALRMFLGNTALNASSGSSVYFQINDSTTGYFSAGSFRVISPTTTSGGILPIYDFRSASSSGYTASTNTPMFKIASTTMTFATGALTTWYASYFATTTIAFVGASTVTSAYGLFIEAPTAGSNATITNNYSAGFNGSIKLDAGYTIYGETTSQFLLLSNSVGSRLAYNSNNYMTVGNTQYLLLLNGASQVNFQNTSQQIHYAFTPSALTASTASTELPSFKYIGASKQFNTGALTTQRFAWFTPNTIAFVGASTATDVYSMYVESTTIGSNATVTNNWALGLSGAISITDVSRTAGIQGAFLLTIASCSGQTASSEISNFKVAGEAKTWGTGALSTQRWNYFTANTFGFDGASTVTNSYGLYVEAAVAGANTTITNNWALGLDAGIKINGVANTVLGNAALATNATTGFLHVPSCAGVPTGVPTLFTGMIPVVADSTNNKLYIYSGGAWVALN